MAIGILTGGGDCPGLNAVIRAVVTRTVEHHRGEVVGIMNGWQGLMEDGSRRLTRNDVRGILARGGTILGTSRKDPFVHGNGFESIAPRIEELGLDRLIVVGGDGTLKTAMGLGDESGFPIIGVPKTIDNDIAATDVTFGFDTAVQIATEAIDRLTTTAEAHNRIMLVEVMGRTKGWIALYAGIAGGADVILIPEVPYDLDEVASVVKERHSAGHRYSVVVVAEGIEPPPGYSEDAPTDAYGFKRLGGVATAIAPELESRTGFESRVTILGHLQRGGTPTATDRVLATRFGVKAADLAAEGTGGVMVAKHGTEMVAVPLADACREVKGVPPALYEVARTFFN